MTDGLMTALTVAVVLIGMGLLIALSAIVEELSAIKRHLRQLHHLGDITQKTEDDTN